MEDTEAPSPLLLEPSMADGIVRLEHQIMAGLDARLTQLQSLQKEGVLETTAFKNGVQKVLNSAQASLFLRTVPFLLDIPVPKGSLTTKELIQKTHQTTEALQAVCRDQARHILAVKAAKVLEKIEAKDKIIRDQIIQKQQAIDKLVKNKTALASPK